LVLLLAIGAAFIIAVRGNTAQAAEAEAAYSRARELCERVGDSPELSPSCGDCGLSIYCEASYTGPMSWPNSSCRGHRARAIQRF
jgi:hypothetical protein